MEALSLRRSVQQACKHLTSITLLHLSKTKIIVFSRTMARRTRSKRKHRRKSRRSNRHIRFQFGGSSCSARPMNHQSFGVSQKGGVAPFNTSGPLLSSTMQGWAGDSGQISAIQESQLWSKQAGGRRRSRRRHSHRRNQRGGNHLAEFSAPYDLGFHSGGTNPQFYTEGSVNQHFGFKGAQA